MKILYLALLLAIFSSGTLWARLGETEDQLIQRYGKPIADNQLPAWASKGVALHYMEFIKNNVTIFAYLLNGVSVIEEIGKGQYPMSDQDKQILLSDNAGGHVWKELLPSDGVSSEKRWLRDDGALAVDKWNGINLTAKAYFEAKEAAKTATQHSNMQGF